MSGTAARPPYDGGVHRRHRQRLKTAFRTRGLDSFLDHQALELLLFYALPRRDVNALAHELIRAFQGLDRVMDASAEELTRVHGAGDRTANLLTLVSQLAALYTRSRAEPGVQADSPERAAEILEAYFFAEPEETLQILLLDGRARVLACQKASAALTALNPSTLAQRASREGAAGVMLALNRGGDPALTPGEASALTRLKPALERMGIQLLDMLLLTPDGAISVL